MQYTYLFAYYITDIVYVFFPVKFLIYSDEENKDFCKACHGSLSSIFCHLDVPFQTTKRGVELFIMLYESPLRSCRGRAV